MFQTIVNLIKSIFASLFASTPVQPVAAPVVVAPPKPAPVIQAPAKLYAILTRIYGQKETRGTLNVFRPDGTVWTCNTLELPWLNNEHMVSCIPAGSYYCTIQPFHQSHEYELSNVPNRTGIFFHAGNYAEGKKVDTLGCILVGRGFADINGDGSLDILDTVNALAQFRQETNNQPFTLQIK